MADWGAGQQYGAVQQYGAAQNGPADLDLQKAGAAALAELTGQMGGPGAAGAGAYGQQQVWNQAPQQALLPNTAGTQGADRMDRLFVSKIPQAVSREDLRTHFEQFGELSDVYLPMPPGGAAHKGICFVSFANPSDLTKALSIKDHLISGQAISVDIAAPRAPPPATVTAAVTSGARLFLTKVSPEITRLELQTYFSQYGELTDCYVPPGNKGIAFVSFKDPTCAQLVLQNSNHQIKPGAVVIATPAFDRPPPGSKGSGKGKGGDGMGMQSGFQQGGMPGLGGMDQSFNQGGFAGMGGYGDFNAAAGGFAGVQGLQAMGMAGMGGLQGCGGVGVGGTMGFDGTQGYGQQAFAQPTFVDFNAMGQGGQDPMGAAAAQTVPAAGYGAMQQQAWMQQRAAPY